MIYDGKNRREPEGWQFKKELSIGDVVAFTSALLAVVYSYTTLEKRISLMEAVQSRQLSIDSRQDADLTTVGNEIKRELEKMNNKLDRLHGYK
jgi:hypothetical protein